MKFLFLLFSLSLAIDFHSWAELHGRQYTPEEALYRADIFQKNLKRIDELNAAANGAKLFGVGPFADMSAEEFEATYLHGLVLPPENDTLAIRVQPAFVPPLSSNGDTFSWATTTKMAPIQNQGKCGSCWSFSATCALETAFALACGKASFTKLAEQQLVDCDNKDGGCNGGFPSSAWSWLNQNGGQALASQYPYYSGSTGKSGQCKPISSYASWCDSRHYDLGSLSDSQLASYVQNHGPASIALYVNDNFQHYTGNIDQGTCCQATQPNHAMVLVGYGSDAGKNYWIIRNSWGTSWGVSGYYKLAWGYCRVAMYAMVPIAKCSK